MYIRGHKNWVTNIQNTIKHKHKKKKMHLYVAILCSILMLSVQEGRGKATAAASAINTRWRRLLNSKHHWLAFLPSLSLAPWPCTDLPVPTLSYILTTYTSKCLRIYLPSPDVNVIYSLMQHLTITFSRILWEVYFKMLNF